MLVTSATTGTKSEPETCTENGVTCLQKKWKPFLTLHFLICLPSKTRMRITEIGGTYLSILPSTLTACFESNNYGQSMIILALNIVTLEAIKMCFFNRYYS
jgi:hypothetical protein